MGKLWVNYIRGEDGTAAAEYALILAIVRAGISVAAIALKDSITSARLPASRQSSTQRCESRKPSRSEWLRRLFFL